MSFGDTTGFVGTCQPATWRGRFTGRDTRWELHYREPAIRDTDGLVRLYDAFKMTMEDLYRSGDAERGPSDWS